MLVTQLCPFVTPWTVACQAPLSIGFSRQEYWSGLPFLLQRLFTSQGLDPHLLEESPALAGGFFTTSATAAAAKSPQSCPTLCDPIHGATSLIY